MSKPIVGYRRVSTDRQGRSGLGLEAQDHVLQTYVQQTAGSILRVYTEVETGSRSERQELAKALAHAKRARAVLAVAVLDRLSRNSLFINMLLESGVEFVDAGSPHDTPFITRIKAAVAQDELEKISQRTKAALAAAKRRGVKLGAHNPKCKHLTYEASKRGAAAAGRKQARLAREAYADIAPLMVEWHQTGLSQAAIAGKLNAEGHTTRRGRPWGQVQVMRVLNRVTN